MRNPFLTLILTTGIVLTGCSHLAKSQRAPSSTPADDQTPDFSDVRVESNDGAEFHFTFSADPRRSVGGPLKAEFSQLQEDTKRTAQALGFTEANGRPFQDTRFAPVGAKTTNVGSEALVLLVETERETGKFHLFQVRGVISKEYPAGFHLVDSRGIEWSVTPNNYASVNIRPADLPIPQAKITSGRFLDQMWLETTEQVSPFNRQQLFEFQDRKLVMLTPKELENLPAGTIVESIEGSRKVMGQERFLANFPTSHKLDMKGLTHWGLRAPTHRPDLKPEEEAPADMKFDRLGRIRLDDGSYLWRITKKQLNALPDGAVLYNAQGERKQLGLDYVGQYSRDSHIDGLGFSSLGFRTSQASPAPGAGEARIVKVKQNSRLKNELLSQLQQKHPSEWTEDERYEYSVAKRVELKAILATLKGGVYSEFLHAPGISHGGQRETEEWILRQYPALRDVEIPETPDRARELLTRYQKEFGKKLYLVRPRHDK